MNIYMKTRKLTLASGIALALLASTGAATADTVSQEITNARQETQIWTTYALSPYLRANDLKVVVQDGKATLSGTVEEDVNKDLAKQIALGVDGVKTVDNKIVVRADYAPPKRPVTRRYGDVIDDAYITAEVKSKLMWSKHVEGSDTNVDTNLGKVTLRGTAESADGKALAGRLALNTPGVRSVDNQLTVKGVPATVVDKTKSMVKEAGDDIADGWITTKVKTTFMYSSNVDGSDIDVSTKDGVVTLSGKVDSGAERALAIEFAANVRGVKSVQSKGLTT